MISPNLPLYFLVTILPLEALGTPTSLIVCLRFYVVLDQQSTKSVYSNRQRMGAQDSLLRKCPCSSVSTFHRTHPTRSKSFFFLLQVELLNVFTMLLPGLCSFQAKSFCCLACFDKLIVTKLSCSVIPFDL